MPFCSHVGTPRAAELKQNIAANFRIKGENWIFQCNLTNEFIRFLQPLNKDRVLRDSFAPS